MPESSSTAVPQSISFEITRRCDQACEYCYNVWKATPGCGGEELDTGSMRELITRAMGESCSPRAVVTGGEPLLRPDALDLVEHAASVVSSVALVTNGSRITSEVAARLGRVKNLTVEVTLLSVRREIHDALRGGPCVDATLEGATRLREHGVPLLIVFVCTRQNHSELPGVLDLAQGLGAQAVLLNRMVPVGAGSRQLDRLAPSVEMLEQCLLIADRRSSQCGLSVSTSIPIPPCLIDHGRFPRVKFNHCSAGTARSHPVVDCAGNVRACSLSSVVLGNLRSSSWLALSRASYLRQLARSLPGSCRSCCYAATCRGGCKEAARACFGSLEDEEPLLRSGKLS